MKRVEWMQRAKALGVLVSATSMVACGGGGGSDAPSSFTITGKAVDGPLQGATACYDLNDNGACDSGEPVSAATGADGAYTIADIAPDAIGKHRVLVDVPASAIDADTGAAVGRSFQLVAPASAASRSHSVFVSPLTTLVSLQMDGANQTRDQAVTFVQSELGLAVSPLADFTAANNADSIKAANAARLALATTWQQSDALAAAVGQTDLSGAAVTESDVQRLAAVSVLGALPMIGASAVDGSLQGKSGVALADAVAALATAVVAYNGVSVPEAVAAIGVGKLPREPVSSATPEPGASLAALRYTSAADWYVRSLQATAADNTPDSDGLVRFFDVRSRVDAANPNGITWGFNNDYTRAGDRYWNGSAWRTCDLGTRGTSTQRDAAGFTRYNYCDGFEKGTTQRSASVDIAGQTLASVLTSRIRMMPGGASGVNFSDWGPADLGLLGAATFPEGSRLFYQSATPTETALAYATRDIDRVGVFGQAVADGGDARSGSVACQNAGTEVPATSLDEMVARRPGRPCIFGQASDANGTGLSANEIWGLSTVSLGDVPDGVAQPAGTGNFYTTTARMRVSFTGSGNGTVYHQCFQARSNGSARNCTVVGTGTYTITTLGDARVMTFDKLPASVQRVTFARVFVERGGVVYFGYKSRVGQASQQVRLNMTAANAMLGQLGLPPIAP